MSTDELPPRPAVKKLEAAFMMADVVRRWPNPTASELACVPLADEILHLRAELAAKDQWQPIETAPKDGRSVIVAHPRGACIARCAYKRWTCTERNHDGDVVEVFPTNWRPFPKPPQTPAPESEAAK